MAPEWISDPWVRRASNLAFGIQAKRFGPFQAWEGAATMPYEAEHVRVDAIRWNPPVPVGIWRSVGNSYNGFVVESFIDELAHLAGSDPAEYRRRLLAGQPRHLAVIDRLVRASAWGEPPAGRHHGIAVHACYGSVVGQVAEVSVDDNGRIRVHHVYCVIDCGTPINPDVIAAQMESGIIFGLTAALHGRIDIDDGAVRQSNFHDYRMLRMADAPAIDVEIIGSTADPGGVGEAGTPPIAAAVANAVFAATGRRLRELPLRLDG